MVNLRDNRTEAHRWWKLALFALALAASLHSVLGKERSHQTENVFLIVSDGFRWQEVFNGAEEDLLNKTNGGVKNVGLLRTNFWRDTAEARREALLPFVWEEIARHGQLYGNQKKGSIAKVTNDKRFSYPGYNEMLTGHADPRINSNDKKLNPNVTVFEWLQSKPHYRNRVVALASWDDFPYIFNCPRSHVPIWPAWEPQFAACSIPVPPILFGLVRDTTPILGDEILDSFLLPPLYEQLHRRRPRLVFLGFAETDDWAHAGRYDLYLDAAHNVDRFIRELWNTVQRIPQYRNKTTFIFTADHGRGSGLTDWKDHGEKIPDAAGIWLGIIGPDTPPLGERTQCAPVTQNQIAATIAALLGEDYQAAFPEVGAPITAVLGGTGSSMADRQQALISK